VSIILPAVTPSDPRSVTDTDLTPASSVPCSATANLSASGPTAPGGYTVTVTASNDDASPQTADCSVAVTVAPFVSAFDKLRTMVDDMATNGGVNPSKAFLLTSRLDRAAADQAAGRKDALRA